MDRTAIDEIAKTYVRRLSEDEGIQSIHWALTTKPQFVALVNLVVRPPHPLSVGDLPAFREYLDKTHDKGINAFQERLNVYARAHGYEQGGNGPGGGHGHDDDDDDERDKDGS